MSQEPKGEAALAESGASADAAVSSAAAAVPLLRVVKGDPSPEELAALIAVVAARSGGEGSAVAPEPTSAWRDRARYVRRPMTPGPNAWRASVLPS